MRMRSRGREGFSLFAAVMMAAVSAFAFSPIPSESAKALGATRGKPFSSGVVFVNGKFISPPYVVERWGTGIRINQTPVTGQVIDWNEFLKTQDNVIVERRTIEPVVEPVVEKPAPPPTVRDDVAALDALYNDDPKPTKPSPPASDAPRPVAPRSAASRTEVKYSMDGAFKPNETSKALLARINRTRTEIDRILRAGGFICFGDGYSSVTGDEKALSQLLGALPELLEKSGSIESFRAGVRSSGIFYLNEVLCEDLFRNRTDYTKLKTFRKRIKAKEEWDNLLQKVSDPTF